MNLSARLVAVLDWLREGYPAGVPPKDHIPLLALLRSRLTEAEVRTVAELVATEESDVAVQITRLTDALPAPDDVARVEARLVSHHGWPID